MTSEGFCHDACVADCRCDAFAWGNASCTLYAGGATVSALAWAPRTNVADAAETDVDVSVARVGATTNDRAHEPR